MLPFEPIGCNPNPNMSQHSKSLRHQSPEQQKAAQTYGLRIVIGKTMLILAAGVALAAVFLLGTVRSPEAIGAMIVGGLCVVAFFIGDFPAMVRCPGCGKWMKTRTHRDPHAYKRFRYLDCPACHQTIDLEKS